MKKIVLTLSVMFALSQANAQCQSQCRMIRHTQSGSPTVNMTVTAGLAKTMNFEFSARVSNVHIGAGVGVMVDTQMHNQLGIEYKRNDTAVFGTLAYQHEKMVLGIKAGSQDKIFVTGVVNGVQQSIPSEKTTMFGVFAGYSLTERTRINFGLDTFNDISIGVALGL